jgi:hypothetical protein
MMAKTFVLYSISHPFDVLQSPTPPPVAALPTIRVAKSKPSVVITKRPPVQKQSTAGPSTQRQGRTRGSSVPVLDAEPRKSTRLDLRTVRQDEMPPFKPRSTSTPVKADDILPRTSTHVEMRGSMTHIDSTTADALPARSSSLPHVSIGQDHRGSSHISTARTRAASLPRGSMVVDRRGSTLTTVPESPDVLELTDTSMLDNPMGPSPFPDLDYLRDPSSSPNPVRSSKRSQHILNLSPGLSLSHHMSFPS